MTTPHTYESLVDDLQSYCERDDAAFIAQVPRFIALAEIRLATEDKPLGILRVVTGNLSGAVLEKPIRWRKTRNLSIVPVTGVRKFLKNRGYEYCRAYWPSQADQDVPEYYSDYDFEHHLIVPTPDQAYNFELQYYELPQPLSMVNQTNWYTQYAYQLLLYAAMMEAMPFLKTSERLPEFQALYNQALSSVKMEDSMRMLDSTAVRS